VSREKSLSEIQPDGRVCRIEGCEEQATYIYTELEEGQTVWQFVYCSKDAGIASVMNDVPIS
jgi:hypothetical protein